MKMRSLILSLTAVAAAVISAPASAQIYAGVGAGAVKPSGIDGSGVAAAVPFIVTRGDATKTSWKLVGGYQFTPNWGLEAQYSNLGTRSPTATFGAPINASGTFSGTAATQWSLAGTGTYPLDSNLYAMGKLGATRNKIDGTSLTILGVTVSEGSDSKTYVLAGAGVGYNFNKNIGVRLEYENFGKFSSNRGVNGGGIKADGWSFVLKYAY